MTNETGGRKLLFLMTGEQAEAFARLVEAAGRGDGGAACRLGDLYREGLGGVRYSPKEAHRWYAKSALAGDANGQNNLGACYEHGLGCAQSYPKAVKWYRLSAAQKLNTASMNLGYCYLHGHGVARDQVEALRLFREAVAGGEERAREEVERLEGERDSQVREPVPSDTPRARPCGLGARVRPCDGPRAQLPHLDVAMRELSETAGHQTAPGGDVSTNTPAASTGRPRPRVRFVDRTQSGQHVGLVGLTGVQPPRPVEGNGDGGPSAEEPGCHLDTEGEI